MTFGSPGIPWMGQARRFGGLKCMRILAEIEVLRKTMLVPVLSGIMEDTGKRMTGDGATFRAD